MTPEGERFVRETWTQFAPVAANYNATFCEKLSSLDPDAGAAFERAGAGSASRPLVELVGALIATIDEPERFVRALVGLGRRHAGHGVRHADYEAAGVALLWTLEEALGPSMTEEARDAWREGCHAMTAVLRRVTSSARASHP
jgi:hemoglobin-like flavoprotein